MKTMAQNNDIDNKGLNKPNAESRKNVNWYRYNLSTNKRLNRHGTMECHGGSSPPKKNS